MESRGDAVVVAVVNQKGGVGKTTTVVNVAAGLVELGQRVLLIDMDPQASLTFSVGCGKKTWQAAHIRCSLTAAARGRLPRWLSRHLAVAAILLVLTTN